MTHAEPRPKAIEFRFVVTAADLSADSDLQPAKLDGLLSESEGCDPSHDRATTRAPRRALPRRRAVRTNSMRSRYSGSFSCEIPRCGQSQERSRDHVPSMVLTWISQKPSPSSSRAYSPRAWQTVACR